MPTEWITPGLVVAVGLFLWRRIDRICDRMDRHLEGHP